jgi:hypothetical protein
VARDDQLLGHHARRGPSHPGIDLDAVRGVVGAGLVGEGKL